MGTLREGKGKGHVPHARAGRDRHIPLDNVPSPVSVAKIQEMNPTERIPMSLPTIHPLQGYKAPRWATDEQGEKRCGCDHCQHWCPLLAHVRAQLDKEGNQLLDELVLDWMKASEDRDVAAAKLDGTWPGWEWLPTEIEKRRLA